MSEGTILRLEGAERRFQGKGGIASVSITVPTGTVYALCGANGAGKTTTLSVIAGLVFASAGTLVWDGATVPLDRHHPRPGLGFVPDTPLLDEHLTPWQWLEFVAAVKGHRIPADATAWAERLRIAEPMLGQPIRTLSFGNRRKVGLWVEMLTTSRLLLLDEPLIGLDPPAIEGFHAAAREFVASGRSIVLSTHLLREAELLATRVGIINEGVTVQEGTMEEVCAGDSLQSAFLQAVG